MLLDYVQVILSPIVAADDIWLGNLLGDDETQIEIQPCIGQPMYLKLSDLNVITDRYLVLRQTHDEIQFVDTTIPKKKSIIRDKHLNRTYR